MKIATIGRAAGVAFALGASFSLGLAAFAPGVNLYISGGLVSSRVIQHEGIAYVPIADVAKALNQTVVTKADGYSLTPVGGSVQVSGLNGKIGDKISNGEMMLTVVKAFRTDKYIYQFGQGDMEPNVPNDDVVVVVLRLKNMRSKETQIAPWGDDNTALTDQDEHSYKTKGTDQRGHLPTLLPASAYDFAMTFSVPKTEKIGDLVYQLCYIDNHGKPGTYRVSLASINP
jgi:hypothetical protein